MSRRQWGRLRTDFYKPCSYVSFVQNLFCLRVFVLYKAYSKRTEDPKTRFHVTARNAQKGSTGKRLPVSVFAKKHFLTDFSSNQQVMAATQLCAIVALMLRMLKPAKCRAQRHMWIARPRVLKTLVVSFLFFKTCFCVCFFFTKHIPSKPTTWRPFFTSWQEVHKRGALGNACR